LKHLPAIAFGVLDVLNAATGTLKRLAQDSFALGKSRVGAASTKIVSI
jgi:hypothetical protein